LAKGIEVRVERSGKQAAPNGVAQPSPGLCLILEPSVVRAEVHALATAEELERPRAGFNPCFKLELTGQARSDGGDAFHGLKALPVVGDQVSLQPTDGNR
jgi:hypothetical protein